MKIEESDILENAVNEEEYSLRALQYWLDYGKHSWALGAVIFFLPLGIISVAIKIAAVIFVPYMLWHLCKAGWHKSSIMLLTVVVLPFIISAFMKLESNIFNYVFTFLPILTLYFYCYIISYMIDEHLHEVETLKKWKRDERIKG